MGLIKAGMGALGGTLADQWKEFFYCDSLDKDVLMVKGQKRTSRRSSNYGEDNIITNGSGIAVADGQCMLIVEQGKVVEVCAEPGEYIFEQGGEPSIFYGPFNGEKMKAVLKTTFDRLSFGGQAGRDQRVYFFNTKEILGNKYGTPSPVPFRVVDSNIGLDSLTPLPAIQVEEEDTASIIYTSGTTGFSKGVELTHRNLVWNARQCATIQPVSIQDRFLSILPLAHTYENTLGLLLPVMFGAQIYYLDRVPTPKLLVPAMQKIRPTVMSVSYTHLTLPTIA